MTTPIDFLSSRFHYTFGPHAPTLTIEPGTTLRVICPDSGNVMHDDRELAEHQRHRDAATELMEGNPLAGPVYVKGARHGGTLSVTIGQIELDRRAGRTWLGPGHGLLPEHLVSPRGDGEDKPDATVPRYMYHWDIDPQSDTATITNPRGGSHVAVKLNPFVGCIGVCPKWGQSVSALYSGPFGGNMDLPLVRPGATVFLPVCRDGALLMMGDIHAAQGHGEIIGGAIETSGKIVCTVRVLNDQAIDACRVCDGQSIWALGSHGELREAVRLAYAHLLDWLASTGVVDRFDLYNLISQAGTVTLGNLLEPPYPVAAGMCIGDLPPALREAMAIWIP